MKYRTSEKQTKNKIEQSLPPPQKKTRQKTKKQTKKQNKKNKNKNKIEISESDSDNGITEFPRFIVIESQEETPLAKLIPFSIERVIPNRVNLRTTIYL